MYLISILAYFLVQFMSDKPFVNLSNLDYVTQEHGDKFEAKYAVLADRPLGRNEEESSFIIFGKQDSGVDYWEDE